MPKSRVVPFLILAVFALLCCAGAYWSFQLWRDRTSLGSSSEDWPTTPAKFQSGNVAFVRSGTKDSTPYQARVRYSFQVHGVTHFSDVISSVSQSFRTRNEAQAFLDQYPKDKLTAHYNPNNPNEAVLETGTPFLWKLLILLPVMIGGFALYLLYSAFKTLTRSPEQPQGVEANG